MRVVQVANWVVAFAVEMWMLWAFAEWGYRSPSAPALRWGLALAAPAAASAIWGKWAAPKAVTRLPAPWLWVLEWTMFALAAAAMLEVGRSQQALLYLILSSVSIALSAHFHAAGAKAP